MIILKATSRTIRNYVSNWVRVQDVSREEVPIGKEYEVPENYYTESYFTNFEFSKLTFEPTSLVDRIVMDVYSPSGTATGLPTGAPSPVAGKLTTIDFEHSGPISTIGWTPQQGYFEGCIRNVRMYNSTALIHHFLIDEDFTTETVAVDRANGNNAVKSNISSSELQTFEEGTGWVGPNIIVGGDFSNDRYATGWRASSVLTSSGRVGWYPFDGALVRSTPSQQRREASQRDNPHKVGALYRVSLDVPTWSQGILALWNNTQVTLASSAGTFTTTYVAATASFIIYAVPNANPFVGSIDNVSAKRILEVHV